MNQHVCSPHRGWDQDIQDPLQVWDFESEQPIYLPSSVPHNEPIDDAIDHGAFFVLPTEPSWLAGRLRWRAKILTEFAPHMRIESDGWCVNDLLAEASGKRERERELQEETFGRLTRQWREETAGFSSPARITSNQAYLSIIALGQPVVPLILAELRDHGGFWYPALTAITGGNPVPASAMGNPRLMKDAWLNWGQRYELIA